MFLPKAQVTSLFPSSEWNFKSPLWCNEIRLPEELLAWGDAGGLWPREALLLEMDVEQTHFQETSSYQMHPNDTMTTRSLSRFSGGPQVGNKCLLNGGTQSCHSRAIRAPGGSSWRLCGAHMGTSEVEVWAELQARRLPGLRQLPPPPPPTLQGGRSFLPEPL